jgi:hypothetical protein
MNSMAGCRNHVGRRRWLMAVGAAAAISLLAGCAGVFGPHSVELSQAQLQQLIARQFPIERRYLELLDVSLAAPQLQLRPETNRLAAEFEVRVTDRLYRVPHRGSLVLNCGLRFEASDHTLRLADVRVDRLDVDGSPALLRQQLDRVAVLLAEQALNDRVVYALRPKDIDALEGRGLRPGDIRVRATGVLVTLAPR